MEPEGIDEVRAQLKTTAPEAKARVLADRPKLAPALRRALLVLKQD